MTPLNRTLRGTAFAVMACCTLFLASCSSDVSGRAVPAAGENGSSTSSSAPTTTIQAAPSGQEGEDIGGDIDFDVEIGQCVELGGTQYDATIDNADCGSERSNYKVIAKTPTQAECPSDIDQSYYETFADIEQGALCLDIDWVIGGCMDLGSEDPNRIDCSLPQSDSYYITDIIEGTIDVEDCADPATGGFRKSERNFTVCFEEL
nr:hypothetical protein [Rhodococcus sp. P1Y]